MKYEYYFFRLSTAVLIDLIAAESERVAVASATNELTKVAINRYKI